MSYHNLRWESSVVGGTNWDLQTLQAFAGTDPVRDAGDCRIEVESWNFERYRWFLESGGLGTEQSKFKLWFDLRNLQS